MQIPIRKQVDRLEAKIHEVRRLLGEHLRLVEPTDGRVHEEQPRVDAAPLERH